LGKFAEFKKMPSNSKKKCRDRAKGTDDGEDTRDKIADKIEEQRSRKPSQNRYSQDEKISWRIY